MDKMDKKFKYFSYTSVIKINGVPILPPLMTKKRRKEMAAYRQQAVQVEMTLHETRRQEILKSSTQTDGHEMAKVYTIEQAGNDIISGPESSGAKSDVDSACDAEAEIPESLDNTELDVTLTEQMQEDGSYSNDVCDEFQQRLQILDNKQECENFERTGNGKQDKNKDLVLTGNNTESGFSSDTFGVASKHLLSQLPEELANSTNQSYALTTSTEISHYLNLTEDQNNGDIESSVTSSERLESSENVSLIRSNSYILSSPSKELVAAMNEGSLAENKPTENKKGLKKKSPASRRLEFDAIPVCSEVFTDIARDFKDEDREKTVVSCPPFRQRDDVFVFGVQRGDQPPSLSARSTLPDREELRNKARHYKKLLQQQERELEEFKKGQEEQKHAEWQQLQRDLEGLSVEELAVDGIAVQDSTQPDSGPEQLWLYNNQPLSGHDKLFPALQMKTIVLPQKAFTAEMLRKYDRISAVAKGYLTRRLLKTAKIQDIVKTIKDTWAFALDFHCETPVRAGKLSKQEAILQTRLLSQLQAALYDLHDKFFATSIKEKMEMIAQDRHNICQHRDRQTTNTVSQSIEIQANARHGLSSATLKYLRRKQSVGLPGSERTYVATNSKSRQRASVASDSGALHFLSRSPKKKRRTKQ